MLNKILKILKDHETFFWMFIFFLCMGTMFVYYQLEPIYENETQIKNTNLTLINGEIRKTEDYVSMFKNPSFKKEILKKEFVKNDFDFNKNFNYEIKNNVIQLNLKGNDRLKNEILLSSISKLFKDNIKNRLNLENNNIISKSKAEKKEINKSIERLLLEKKEYINEENFNKLQNVNKILPLKINSYAKKINDLEKELKNNKKEIKNLNFKLNIFPDNTIENYLIMRNYLIKEQVYVNMKWQKNKFENDFKKTSDVMNNVNKQFKEYNDKINKLNNQLNNKDKEIIDLQEKLSNKKYIIETIENNQKNDLVENKQLSSYLKVLLFSFLLALPFWKINLI